MDAADLRALVRDDSVSPRVYADPEIFALEQQRIFSRIWTYAAHESEIPSPGDYVRAQIAQNDIIVVRGDDGRINAFYNRCAHRGAVVACAPRGSVQHFECPYHGWCYGRDGKLTAVPHAQGYPEGFAARKGGLEPVARVDSYRGFIFVCLSADVPALADYLLPVRDSLDNMIDRSPEGKLVKVKGGFRQICHSNWKLHIENNFDNGHALFLHRSSWDSALERKRRIGQVDHDQQLQMMEANSMPLRDWDKVRIRAFPGGHGYYGGFYSDSKISVERPEPWFQRYKRDMIARHGEARAMEILSMDRFNTLVYPNMMINIRFQQVRIFQPVSADKTILHAMCFKLVGAPEELLYSSTRFLTALNSPASMISQDDHELFAHIERTAKAGHARHWIDISRRAGAVKPLNNGVEVHGTSEEGLRNQYAAWLNYMTAA